MDMLAVNFLFPTPGTRMSNCTTYEVGHGLEYLHHGNLQVQQIRTFFFLESGWVVKHQHTTEYIRLVCMSAKGPSNLAVFIAGAPGPPPESEGTLSALHCGSRMGSGGREAGFPKDSSECIFGSLFKERLV